MSKRQGTDSEQGNYAKKKKIEDKDVEPSEPISIKYLETGVHENSMKYYVNLHLVKPPRRNFIEKLKKHILKMEFEDSDGALIAAECFQDDGETDTTDDLFTFFKESEYKAWYKIARFRIKPADPKWDKCTYKFKLNFNSNIFIEQTTDMKAAPLVFLDSLKDLTTVTIPENGKPMINLIGMVIKIVEPPTEYKSGSWRSKTVIGDQSNYVIELVLWAEQAKTTKFQVGHVVGLKRTEVRIDDRFGYSLTGGTVLTECDEESFIRFNDEKHHVNTNPRDFIYMSSLKPGKQNGEIGSSSSSNSSTNMMNFQRVSCEFLSTNQASAMKLISDAREKKILPVNSLGRTELSPDIISQCLTGNYTILVSKIAVRDTLKINNDKQSGFPLFYQSCCNNNLHGSFKPALQYVNGKYKCSINKCSQESDICDYAIRGLLLVSDIQSVEIECSLDQFLPTSMTAKQFILDVKRHAQGNPNLQESDLVHEDPSQLNEILVHAFNNLLSSHGDLMLAKVSVKPDLFTGLKLRLEAFCAPDFEFEEKALA